MCLKNKLSMVDYCSTWFDMVEHGWILFSKVSVMVELNFISHCDTKRLIIWLHLL
jgi:hypothetical protein